MNELKTISDSKKVFHQEFPYVIAPIYRRVLDELLVELHLLNHQKDFLVNEIFCLGLSKVFQDFMVGYKPEEHLIKLFNALCNSNNLNPLEITRKAENIIKITTQANISQIEAFFYNKEGAESLFTFNLKSLKEQSKFYSRLSVIGLKAMLSSAKDFTKENQEETNKKVITISKELGLSTLRAEKDLATYNSNLLKINQALELIEESIAREKRKKEERSNRKENESSKTNFNDFIEA